MVAKKKKSVELDALDPIEQLLASETVELEGIETLIENPEAGLDEDDIALMRELEGTADVVELLEPTEEVAPIKKKRTKNYVNNGDLLIQHALSKVQDRMTEEFAKMLQTVADRYGSKNNYREYSYLDDMKAYAMMMVVRTWRSFKVEKSTNAFAFFTQCIKNSFKQYLKIERKARDVRDALLVDAGLNPSYTYSDGAHEGGSDDSFGGGSHYD